VNPFNGLPARGGRPHRQHGHSLTGIRSAPYGWGNSNGTRQADVPLRTLSPSRGEVAKVSELAGFTSCCKALALLGVDEGYALG
jgi:hypothetical protein